MNIHAIHAGQSVLALALAARTFSPYGADDSSVARTGRLPLIGPGTFLVATYLDSRLCPNVSAEADQT
jgi:hypothetical protein